MPHIGAVFAAGIETARQATLIIAVTIETQDGSRGPRYQTAVAALQALFEGARDLMLGPVQEGEATGIVGYYEPSDNIAKYPQYRIFGRANVLATLPR